MELNATGKRKLAYVQQSVKIGQSTNNTRVMERAALCKLM